MSATTPGPWAWMGQGNGSIYLATVNRGRRYVMGFCRKGMNDAQPQFQPGDGGLVKAEDLLQFEVGPSQLVGLKAAKANDRVYRYDVRGIDCADARLIAAVPELYAEYQRAIEHLRGFAETTDRTPETLAILHEAQRLTRQIEGSGR